MIERPILFSAQMVCAILDGRKTVTRRVIKPQPAECGNGWMEYRNGKSKVTWHDPTAQESIRTAPIENHCPYGAPGDLLWVRETFAVNMVAGKNFVFYRADSAPDGDGAKWKPSIFMPRQYSRITLRITSVHAERLKNIKDTDAIAEGVTLTGSIDTTGITTGQPVQDFALLWDSINAERGFTWVSNPFVWVVSFERI